MARGQRRHVPQGTRCDLTWDRCGWGDRRGSHWEPRAPDMPTLVPFSQGPASTWPPRLPGQAPEDSPTLRSREAEGKDGRTLLVGSRGWGRACAPPPTQQASPPLLASRAQKPGCRGTGSGGLLLLVGGDTLLVLATDGSCHHHEQEAQMGTGVAGSCRSRARQAEPPAGRGVHCTQAPERPGVQLLSRPQPWCIRMEAPRWVPPPHCCLLALWGLGRPARTSGLRPATRREPHSTSW